MNSWELARVAIGQYRAAQKPPELQALIERLDGVELRDVLEIGCQDGGTFWLWQKLAVPGAWILSVDLDPSPRALEQMGGDARFCIYRGDSHSDQTRLFVESYFTSRPLDLLFIDGDHTYEGVKLDYTLYEPLVRDGGLVVLHDIAEHPAHQSEVHRFWRELEGDKWESIYPGLTNLWNGGVLPVQSCGIGVLRVVR